MKKVALTPQVITIPGLRLQSITIKLISDSPLICHAWSEKAKGEMRAKQMKQAKTAKAAKDPQQCFIDSLYIIDDERKLVHGLTELTDKCQFGFRTVAFKAAAVDACSHVDGVTKVEARGAFHIDGEYVPLVGSFPEIREDMVRVGMGTADLRYRGMFENWSVELPVRFNANVLSGDQIANLFNTAGFAIGVGEWRPAKDGSFGMFHVG